MIVLYKGQLHFFIHDTHADISTIQETKLTPKVRNFTTVLVDHKREARTPPPTMVKGMGGQHLFVKSYTMLAVYYKNLISYYYLWYNINNMWISITNIVCAP